MFRKSSLMAIAAMSCFMAAADESGGGGGAPPAPAPKAVKVRTYKARVLTDCQHGKSNDLVSLTDGEMEQAVAGGLVDPTPGAVAYAAGLEQNQAKAPAKDAPIE
jgi:hypothetical protein